MREITAEVQQADASESELVERATNADGKAAWIVGECASLWTQRYAKGRTDQAFAEMCGIDPGQVQLRRRVFETFGEFPILYRKLSWSHYRVALTWEDANEHIEWAIDNTASVREMVAWRRMQRGEDLTTESQGDPLPEPPKAAPHAGGTASAGSPAAPVFDTAASSASGFPSGPDVPSSVSPSPFNPLPVKPQKPAAAPSIESRQFTLADLRKWLAAAEDNAEDVRERRKLAAWHRTRAEELDPQERVKVPDNMASTVVASAMGEWIRYRKEKKKPVTPTQELKLLKMWGDRGPERFAAAVEWSIAQGYQGLFEEGGNGKTGSDSEPWRHIEGSGARHVPDTIQVYDAASGGFVTRPAGSA